MIGSYQGAAEEKYCFNCLLLLTWDGRLKPLLDVYELKVYNVAGVYMII